MTGVRAATGDDLPRCREIQAAVLPAPAPALLEPIVTGPAPALVYEDGPVVGYVLAVAATGGPAYVPELAVAPGHQGQGYGTALLAALGERLRAAGSGTVRLTVRADDDHVLGFYRSRGFRVVERRPDHFADGAGLLLERTLGE